MIERQFGFIATRRRATTAVASFTMGLSMIACAPEQESRPTPSPSPELCLYIDEGEHIRITPEETLRCLGTLAIDGLPPEGRYNRKLFGGWKEVGECDTRDAILIRDLKEEIVEEGTCEVLSGKLDDPYTGETDIPFLKGETTSDDIQIDHIVSLSNAWKTGAELLSKQKRSDLANDPLNLQATQGKNNQNKGDDDAKDWTPSNDDEDCRYVARQVLVKERYSLWVRQVERDKIQEILLSCPDDTLTLPDKQ